MFGMFNCCCAAHETRFASSQRIFFSCMRHIASYTSHCFPLIFVRLFLFHFPWPQSVGDPLCSSQTKKKTNSKNVIDTRAVTSQLRSNFGMIVFVSLVPWTMEKTRAPKLIERLVLSLSLFQFHIQNQQQIWNLFGIFTLLSGRFGKKNIQRQRRIFLFSEFIGGVCGRCAIVQEVIQPERLVWQPAEKIDSFAV